MKRWISLLLLLCILATLSFAGANEEDTLIQMTKGLLTEVYGYAQEEADAFTFEIADDGAEWVVRHYLNPAWVYTARIDQKKMEFGACLSPFSTLYRANAAESGIRYILSSIETNGWFGNWNADSKAAFKAAIDWCGIHENTSLERGLQAETYTPSQALTDLFLSGFGDTAQWSAEVAQWQDAAFESLGLAREPAALYKPQGVVQYRVNQTEVYEGAVVCEFTGEVPEALAEAFSNPNLQGYTCLSGVYVELNRERDADSLAGTGLAAFEKDGERLLVMLIEDAKTLTWRVVPVGYSALLPDRDVSIQYGGGVNRFDIVYPITDTEWESFCCRITRVTNTGTFCGLESYRRVNQEEQYSLVIDRESTNAFTGWYHVTTTQSGAAEQALYKALCPGVMEYIDASAFPKTEEACRAAAEANPFVPEGYGISSSVHLRAKATSHSADLGMYRIGTLVEVLGSQPGVDFPWYHVRIGIAEGYMSGNYVAYIDNRASISMYMVLSVGMLKEDTALKDGTGLFSGTIDTLSKGLIVRVLAQRGNWLHISIPFSEEDWMMQPGEVNGYVKKDVLTEASTPLQLQWMSE